ncbi:MAG: OOP family OmpA-OmpF porin [Kiritimatiellia bacterium]|jgi:OOP family OmpA-OmpF porin
MLPVVCRPQSGETGKPETCMRRLLLTSVLGMPAVSMALDVDPNDPSGSIVQGTGTPVIESPAIIGEGFSAGVISTVNENLVSLEWPDGREEHIVPHTFNSVFIGAWTKEDRYRIELVAPIYWHNSIVDSEPFSGAALGDVLVRGNFRLYQADDASFGVSLVPTAGLPTGSQKAMVARGAHLDLKGAIGGEIGDNFGYAANLGFVLQPGYTYYNVAIGSSVDAGAGVWVRPDEHMRLGADYKIAIGTSTADGAPNAIATANVFAQMRTDEGLALTVGAGRGMLKGIGAPDWRAVVGLTYARFKRDQDDDGIVDKEDSCPLDAEDFDGFEDVDGCPEIDNDGDTLIDIDDECPDQAEDFDEWHDLDGCPDLDNDEDGWVDTEDSCPYRPGPDRFQGCPDSDNDGVMDDSDQCVRDPGDPTLAGCPDGDSDQIADFRDACPDVPRLDEEPVEQSNGCPKKAFVKGDRIEITERVLFETGRSTIRGESYDLLDDVTAALRQYPAIRSIQVAGHTDNKGSERYNQRLSNNRAKAVYSYLINHGTDKDRLTYMGFGESDPIDSNFTDSGRQRNRRVEFRIVEQDPITEEVDTQLGDDLGGITIRFPAQTNGYADLFIDGQQASPGAPLRGLIVTPGTHEVRLSDPTRGLDHVVKVTVDGGQTQVIQVPAEAMSEQRNTALPSIVPDTTAPDQVAPELPDGAPLAVPVETSDADAAPETDAAPMIDPGSEDVPAVESGQIWGTDADAFPVDAAPTIDETDPSDEAASPWSSTEPEPEQGTTAASGWDVPVDGPANNPPVELTEKELKKAARAKAKQDKVDRKAREKEAKENQEAPADPLIDPSTLPDDSPWSTHSE